MAVWLINILILAALLTILWRYSVSMPNKTLFWTGALAKIAAGLLVGFLYTYYFNGGDTIGYYNEGVRVAQFLSEHPGGLTDIIVGTDVAIPGRQFDTQPRARFFSDIVGVMIWITGGDYWILSLYFSVISFLGFWYLYIKMSERLPDLRRPALIAFLFFPSVVLWSSGLLKESLAMPALCVIVAFFFQDYSHLKKNLILKGILLIVSFYLLWKLRYFYVAVMVPVLVAYLMVGLLRNHIAKIKWTWQRTHTFFLTMWVAIILMVSTLHYNLKLENVARIVYENYQQSSIKSKEGYFVRYEHMAPSFVGIIKSAPKALMSALYRPNVWDYRKPLQIPAIIENVFLLLATLWLIWRRSTWQHLKHLSVFGSLIYIVQLAVLLALSSPNFGTLYRYRVGFLPFLVYLLLAGLMINKKALQK